MKADKGKIRKMQMRMNEEFLQYLWRFRLINGKLETRGGEEIVICHPGDYNRDSGPDFLNARIRIGETLWAGNVEIHLDEADWFRHNHQNDEAYGNVILHVVYSGKSPGPDSRIPVLVLKGNIPESLLDIYSSLLENQSWVPCENLVKGIDPIVFTEWASGLVVEKLREKCAGWEKLLEANGFDWAETLHQVIAQVFGLKLNCLPFEILARVVPLKLVLRQKFNPAALEALVFGQAGMLDREFSESYPNQLKDEYRHLAAKYALEPMDVSLWKFLRLRPASFPTVRIAQWASALRFADRFFGLVTEREMAGEFADVLSVTASAYWDSHFLFGKLSPSAKKSISRPTLNLFILNAAAPFLFFYGNNKGSAEMKERALRWIDDLPAEENHIITRWRELGFPVQNALHTQALLWLKSRYCDMKRCLECRIGMKVMQGERTGCGAGVRGADLCR